MRTMTLALRVAFLLFALLWTAQADAATCFWVGGTGSWNTATHWSSSTGGAGSTCAATSSIPKNAGDVATFDGASGGGTATIDITLSIATINMAAFTGTLNDGGSSVTLTTAFNNSGTATRTLVRSGAWILSNTTDNGTVYDSDTSTNFTQTDSGSITISGATGTKFFNLGSTALTYNNIIVGAQSGAGIVVFQHGALVTHTFTTLAINAPAAIATSGSRTIAITNALNINGSSSNQIFISCAAIGFSGVSTWALGANATFTWVALRGIGFTTSSATATNSFNLGGNTFGAGGSITGPTTGGGGSTPCITC